MTVAELIEKLKVLPQDLNVYYPFGNSYGLMTMSINEVEIVGYRDAYGESHEELPVVELK